MKKKIGISLVALLAWCVVSFAQETDGQINPNSLLAIPKYEQLYKVKVWRNLDLREKQNKGFYAKGNEMTKIIIAAIKSGELADVYASDSLTAKKPKDEFISGLTAQQGIQINPWDPATSYYVGDRAKFEGKDYEATDNSTGVNPSTGKDQWQPTSAGKAIEFSQAQMHKLTLVEDVIFDKRRSRLYYDILAIGIEAFDEEAGGYRKLGYLKYKDLEKVFRNHPDEAIWFNRYNTAENRNYADAFLLRLFHATIDKVENPDDDRIFDTYLSNGRPYREAVWATEWEEMKMMEREHNLWEF